MSEVNTMNGAGWTEDNIATLKTMWGDGASASEIARVIGGVSRSAIIGKVHRLKLTQGRKKPQAAGAPKAARPVAARPAAPRQKPPVVARVAAPKAQMPGPEIEEAPVVTVVDTIVGIPLLDLTDKTCRWPIGDPQQPGFAFCGAWPDKTSPYCAMHHHRAVVITPRQTSAR
jgi:GcrA cell cycle regulator